LAVDDFWVTRRRTEEAEEEEAGIRQIETLEE